MSPHGGERRLLRVVAVAHASGFDTPSRTSEMAEDTPRFGNTTPLCTWPEQKND
ncbi:hypothetical protein [Rathayibacter tanaceti]|uniref:Uncharacterized protein n=1 Tax=Rathayibacter tanaceti TaxID=1671680 RepID=A0AAE6RLX1_9MICO|nr:hypothetical protein [Rathayibacter tanaceti]QHC56641.1 hypothetical protein GSU10_14070 [Rathayibacter tanaceti]